MLAAVTWLFSVYKYNQVSHVVPQTFLSERSRIKHKKASVLQTHCQDFPKLLTPRMLENKRHRSPTSLTEVVLK